MSKILLIGQARHGKDTVAEILRGKYGATFGASSEFACRHFIFDSLKSSMGYTSPTQCFLKTDMNTVKCGSR